VNKKRSKLLDAVVDGMKVDEILDERLWGNRDFFASKIVEGVANEEGRLSSRKRPRN